VSPESFSHLTHAAQLALLDRTTRVALTQHYGFDGSRVLMENMSTRTTRYGE